MEFPDGLWFRTVRLPLANQCISHTLKPEHACKKLLGNFKRAGGKRTFLVDPSEFVESLFK